MGRRWWTTLGLVLLLAAGGPTAGETEEPVRIGILATSFGLSPHAAGLRAGLEGLGYRENADFDLAVRFIDGDPAALQRAVVDLIWSGADVIVAMGAGAAQAARSTTQRIPIVFAGVLDPVGLGLVERLERPGGNVTGVADHAAEIGAQRLEMFRALVPGLKRVLYVHDAGDAASLALARVYQDAGRRLGLEVVNHTVRSEKDADKAFAQIARAKVQGIIGPMDPSFNLAGHVLDAAKRRRLPTVGGTTFWAEAGALMSYGADLHATGRQVAGLVDRILRGDKPGDIPVELNEKIELSVNVETARTLGLPIVPVILDHADRVFR